MAALVSIVDDHESIRRALRRLITSAGLTVDTFGSAEEFLERGDTDTTCLILDVRLPGMSGLDLQERLVEINPRIAVIIVSAYGTPQMTERTLKAGAIDFLNKPFSQERLLQAVRQAVEARG